MKNSAPTVKQGAVTAAPTGGYRLQLRLPLLKAALRSRVTACPAASCATHRQGRQERGHGEIFAPTVKQDAVTAAPTDGYRLHPRLTEQLRCTVGRQLVLLPPLPHTDRAGKSARPL